MNRWIYGLWWCLLLAAQLEGVAQPGVLPAKKISFEQLPDELGLSQRSINCILQDREGFLWIGTWSGLIRYDGYTTTVFYSGQGGSLKSNKITSLLEDRMGNLWVGTHMGGVFQYVKSNNEFIQFSHDEKNPESLSNNNVRGLQEDRDGNIWVGTEYGLNVFDGIHDKFRKFYNDPADRQSLSQNFITDLHLSSKHELWISTQKGLNRLFRTASDSGYAFESFFYFSRDKDNNLHNYVIEIDESIDGDKSTIWFSTKKGLKKLQSGEITSFLVDGEPAASSLAKTVLCVNGKIPFVLMGSEMGLHFFDPVAETFTKSLRNYEESGNLSHAAVTALYIDRGGVLWVGTKKGLNKYDSYSKDFEVFKTAAFDRSKNNITGIQASSKNGYWISTIGGGLYRLRDGKYQHVLIDDKENAFTNFIKTLFVDTRGRVWLGTDGAGVYSFDEKTLINNSNTVRDFDHFHLRSAHPINDDFITSIEEDSRGKIWIGTWNGGLNKINPDGSVVQYNQPALKNAPLVVMHADLSDVLWVGTRGNGLYRVKVRDKDPVIHVYRQDTDSANSISSNFVNTIFEDHAGTLWIGTEDGLNSFDRRTETFSMVRANEDSWNSSIVSILEDDNGKLWLAHSDGLTVIDPLDPAYLKNYDRHDQIQGGFHYSNACFKDLNGRLLFAGSEGFNIINPQTVVMNPTSAGVVIQNFEIFNKPILPGILFNDRILLDKPFSQTDEIALRYFENTMSFEFSALNYAAPEKIRYAFMLEGFDKDWNYSNASRRYANYTNLDHGIYTFKVKATNNDGVWNEQLAEVRILISPPWWKTGWAFLLYAGLSLLILYTFRKLILMRADLIHNIKFERMQRENLENLNRAKLQFFTNISHEFRTPLTLILGPVQNLIDAEGGDKFMRDQFHHIHNNAQRLLRLINELLDFRKAETGNLKLEVAEGNLVKFVKEIKLSFDGLAEQMKADFSFYASSNVVNAWFDRDQFEKIMFNLLSNAFKHAPEHGKVSIRIIENPEDILIVVEDSGKGVKPEHFETIFQTFFTYDEDHHHTGTGIGLALTKSLVESHHGTIRLSRVENQFTRFTIRLLKGHSHFGQSELLGTAHDVEKIEQYPQLSVETLMDRQDAVEQVLRPLEDQHKLLVVEDNPDLRD